METVIFINNRKHEIEAEELSARELLALLGITAGYDLFLLQGEGDPSGGRCILADERVPLRNGMRFRAQPGDCTFGDHAAGVPALLTEHAKELGEALGCEVEVKRSDAQLLVVVRQAKLPSGHYTVERSDVLLVTDIQYPASAMDMFFMEEHVRYADGRIPNHATGIVQHAGRTWRQWSWHRNGRWTPGADDLLSHWAFVEACWAKEIADASAGAPR